MSTHKLKMGMIGGGTGSFIGAIHRIATRMDDQIELVAGAFSSDHAKCIDTGKSLRLDAKRCYASYEEMIDIESKLPEEERVDFVSIVTPNHVHAAPALLALKQSIPVVLDKPLTQNLTQAKELHTFWKSNPIPFAVTYTYAGYPMIQKARQLVKSGELGKIKKVYVNYLQGWLSTPLEQEGNKQASWRTDPNKSGKGGALGDIGCHAFHLAEFVSCVKVNRLGATLESKVNGRRLDDDGMVWLQFENGASGMLLFSQIATGMENNITIKVVGEKASLHWEHEKANSLLLFTPEGVIQELRAGVNYAYMHDLQKTSCRTPGGHPEGYLEAFANQYSMFAKQVRDWKQGKAWQAAYPSLPTIEDGLRGMQFIETAFLQSQTQEKWGFL